MRLTLGQCVITPGAQSFLLREGISPALLLARHARGDWGDLDPADALLNEQALDTGHPGRIMSAYRIGPQVVWVITEHDRSFTTILLPDEY